MKNFLKAHSPLIVKFIINQIALTIFGLVLYLSTYQNTWLAVAASVFSLLFYCYLLLNASVDFAKHEKLRIDSGKSPYKPINGLYASLCANVLNILLALGIIIGKIFTDTAAGTQFSGIFQKLSLPNTALVETPAWAYKLIGFCQPVFHVFNGMYMGIINTFAPNNSLAFMIMLIPSIFVSWFGYYSGIRGLSYTRIFDEKPKSK